MSSPAPLTASYRGISEPTWKAAEQYFDIVGFGTKYTYINGQEPQVYEETGHICPLRTALHFIALVALSIITVIMLVIREANRATLQNRVQRAETSTGPAIPTEPIEINLEVLSYSYFDPDNTPEETAATLDKLNRMKGVTPDIIDGDRFTQEKYMAKIERLIKLNTPPLPGEDLHSGGGGGGEPPTVVPAKLHEYFNNDTIQA